MDRGLGGRRILQRPVVLDFCRNSVWNINTCPVVDLLSHILWAKRTFAHPHRDRQFLYLLAGDAHIMLHTCTILRWVTPSYAWEPTCGQASISGMGGIRTLS